MNDPVGAPGSTPGGDRRPIAARHLRPTILLADWLVRRGASANAISVAGMICALLAGWTLAVAPGSSALWLAAAVLIQLRLLANMLDGMVAVGRGVASAVGELYNEVPDRISDTAVLIGVGFAAGQTWLGWAAALAAMATAYIRALGKSMNQPSDFRGPMAKPHRMALLTALCVWCALAPTAWTQRAPEFALYIILTLSAVTAGRRLLRLASALQSDKK